MKFFNIDLHISVIEDIKSLFSELGHSVISWNMSGHNWVFGRNRATPEVINHDNWHKIDQAMCDAFYTRYKDELSKYDGFIVTYAPVLAQLFEKFGKPIIIDIPIRYELTCTFPKEKWLAFNEFLQRGVDNGQILLVANNLFDKYYTEYFLARTVVHIPSYCGYTCTTYAPTKDSFLYSSRLPMPSINKLCDKNSALHQGYKWNQLTQFKGIVHIPYNVSTMSIFENYAQCMPMYFPTQEFMCKLREAHPHKVLSETTWTSEGSLIREKGDKTDPNNFMDMDVFKHWLKFADFYDEEWMPHFEYFDSWEDLQFRIAPHWSGKIPQILSRCMKEFNPIRKMNILYLWEQLLKKVK